MVSAALQFPDLLDRQPEQEEVLCANFLADLHIGTVKGTDREGAVESKLHVAGTAGLLAGHGDLLGQIPGWVDMLSALHAEIRQENDPETIAHRCIVVNHFGDGVDKLDDELGHEVAEGAVTTEDKSARGDAGFRIVLQT